MYLMPASSRLETVSGGSYRNQSVSFVLTFFNQTSQYTYGSRHLDCICARHVALQTLPPRYPTDAFVGDTDQALEDLRSAFLDSVIIPAEAEDVLAVGTAFSHKFLINRQLIRGSSSNHKASIREVSSCIHCVFVL
jgi:hypothetical protein